MDAGCDVDQAVVSFITDDWSSTPLHNSKTLDEDEEELSWICQRYLLQAGADSTSDRENRTNPEESRSFIEQGLTGDADMPRTTVSLWMASIIQGN